MTYTFDATARNQLDALLEDDDYPAAYILLSDILKSADPVSGARPIDDVAVHQTQLFLEGAALVNNGAGVFPDRIRDYTRAQGIVRYGNFFSGEELQDASDAVATAVLTSIAANGISPAVGAVAGLDAPAVRDSLFPDLNDLNPA